MSISFNTNGDLIVKAPLWVPLREIEAFLSQKESWIVSAKAKICEEKQKRQSERIPLENGDVLSFLGEKRFLLVLREDRKNGKVKNVMDKIILWLPYDADYDFKHELLEKWYRKEARTVIKEKAEELAEILNVSFEDIHIKDQKSRWGSCSSHGNLNFNWRIIMAPEPVCDYIIIHELCHLKHMNHSKEFWNLVRSICPQYEQYKKWLKENADILYF